MNTKFVFLDFIISLQCMKNKTQTSKNSMEVVDLCPLKNKLFVMNVKVEIPVKKNC